MENLEGKEPEKVVHACEGHSAGRGGLVPPGLLWEPHSAPEHKPTGRAPAGATYLSGS